MVAEEKMTTVFFPCAYCGATSQQRLHPFTCSRCLDVKYCSKDHQLRHWTEAHRVECRGAGGKRPTLAEQVANLRLAMLVQKCQKSFDVQRSDAESSVAQAHAEKTRRISEEIAKAGAERNRILQDVSTASEAVEKVAAEKRNAEREVAAAQRELKAKSREIEMCLSMMGGRYDSGYEASSEWGDPPTLTAGQAAALAEGLADRRWAFIDGYIDMTAVEKMRTCWLDRFSNGTGGFGRGRMGGGRSGQNIKYIEEGFRGDFVRWLSPQDEDCPVGYRWLRAGMDLLVQDLARNCRCAALKGVDTV
ncbi:hypothetical protein FOZ63_020748, partial [Perkinsus olseni]